MDAIERAVAMAKIAGDKLDGIEPDRPLPRILSVEDVFTFKDPAHLVERIVPEGALILLDAYTGAGKSLTTLELALSICDGFPLFGQFQVNRTGPVLLFDEETPEPYLKDRLRRMGFTAVTPLSTVHFSGLKLDEEKGFDMIRRIVEHVKPVLVIFDSLIRFHSCDENSTQEMSVVMERLRAIVNMGTTVWTQHHLNKGAGDLRMRSRGSSDIVGAVDLELALMPKDNILILQSVKSRAAPVAPITLKIVVEDDRLHVVYQAEQHEKDQAEAKVRELLSGRALSVREIEAELESAGIRANRMTVRRVLDGLDGDLTVQVLARGRKVYSLEPSGGQVVTTWSKQVTTSGQAPVDLVVTPPPLGVTTDQVPEAPQ